MAEFFLDYAAFFAKVLTIVIAIIAIIAIILVAVGAAARRGRAGADNLQVKHLNQRYDSMRAVLQEAVLSKDDFKRLAKERKREKKRAEKSEKASPPTSARRVFVIDFEGDLRASGIDSLREEVTAVLTIAAKTDEVVIRLENAGGVVHGHGLAASQLARFREREIPLTVAVDKVAASGGYMMACVANQIICAPFAIIGSIGVLAQLPNFHRLLNKHGVDFEQVMAGEYKRTVTVFGENTEEGRSKLQSDLDDIHQQFKGFISQYRPDLDIDRVATGEHWHGQIAQELGLVDAIVTSDDYLLNASKDAELYEVSYAAPSGLTDKLTSFLSKAVTRGVDRLAAPRSDQF